MKNAKHFTFTAIPIAAGLMALAAWSIGRLGRKSTNVIKNLGATAEKYRGIIESAQDAIVVVDSAGSIEFVNKQALNWFGYARKELIGQPIEILVPERMRELHVKCKRAYIENPVGRPMGRPDLRLKARRKDGSEFPVDIALSPYATSEGMIFTAIIRDISARMAFEKERESFFLLKEKEASKNIEMAIAARDEFLLAAAHELKTPLTSLMLQAHMIKKYFDQTSKKMPADEKAMSNLLALQIQFKHLDVLINKVLDASKASLKKTELKFSEFDLSALARELALASSQESSSAGCPIEVSADHPVIGNWDRTRIEVLILNLITNAIKFGNSKPITIKVESDGEKAVLSIIDRGIGIAKEDQSKLFGKFERFVSVDHYPGMGIGLYIVRQVVDAHGGRINVVSELGHGTTFRVELPLKRINLDTV